MNLWHFVNALTQSNLLLLFFISKLILILVHYNLLRPGVCGMFVWVKEINGTLRIFWITISILFRGRSKQLVVPERPNTLRARRLENESKAKLKIIRTQWPEPKRNTVNINSTIETKVFHLTPNDGLGNHPDETEHRWSGKHGRLVQQGSKVLCGSVIRYERYSTIRR